MNIREMFKQVARQVMDGLSNIALALKVALSAKPEAPQLAMAAAVPGLGLGSSGGARLQTRRRTPPKETR